MSGSVARVVVGLPIETFFDYSVPLAWRSAARPGARVLVSFARRKCLGIIVSLADQSDFSSLKPLLAVLDEEPALDSQSLRFAEVFALRFGCAPGEALELLLPKYWRRPLKRIALARVSGAKIVCSCLPPKNVRTDLFFDYRREQSLSALLVRVHCVIEAGRGVLVLVPDGGYLEGVLSRFRENGLDPLLLTGGTNRDEAKRWDCLRDGGANLAVGFISAVLAPMANLGLIVVIDEENSAYKSDRAPFYHAREAAFLRARLERCEVILVSSAPSVEAWYEAASERGRISFFKELLPPVRLVDLGNFKMRRGTVLSPALRFEMEKALKAGGKILLYIQAAQGTATILEEIKLVFPFVNAAGYERSSGQWPDAAAIVVATQAVFRFRDNLRVDFSCVLDVDREFYRSDSRATHAAFALTRYLRGMTQRLVLLQTRNVNNTVLHLLAGDDPQAFYLQELAQRKEMEFPPFYHFVALVVRSVDAQLACSEAGRLYEALRAECPGHVRFNEPQPDRNAVLRGKHRWCVMAQGGSLKILMGHIKTVLRSFRGKRDVVLTVNVDP